MQYYLIKTLLCITRLMPKIDVYKSSHLVYDSTGNIDMLSTEEFFYFQKGKVNYSTQFIMKCPH